MNIPRRRASGGCSQTTFTTPLNQAGSLYVGYFGRAGNPAGKNYWIGQLNLGFSPTNTATSFAAEPEATGKYPYLANPNVGDPGAFVDEVFRALWQRTGSPAQGAEIVQQIGSAGATAIADPANEIVKLTQGRGNDSLGAGRRPSILPSPPPR